MLEQELNKNANLLTDENQTQIVNVKISDIYPNNTQPRIHFDEDKIIALCESIKKHGVLQPIVLRKDEDGKYMIIAGERRYRASIMAKKQEIPAIIKNIPIKEVMEIALVENLQRENLNIIEEGKAYKNLIEEYHSTQEEIAELVGKSRPYITNTMRLLNLSEEVKKYIELNKISPGHGKALLRVSDEMKQIELAQRIINENLSVRKTEEIVKNIVEDKKITREEAEHHPKKNMLLKALGCTSYVEPDIRARNLEKDDILLMCSDGLTNMVEESKIYEVVRENKEKAPEILVNLANNAGGYDNITVITII